MTPGAYLRNMRERRGHSSVSSLASFMQSRGHSLSREALRQYETDKSVPGADVRSMLYDSLVFSAEDVSDFERTCAESTVREKYNIHDAYLVDHSEAIRRSNHIVAQVRVGLYGLPDLSDAQIQSILDAVEVSCLLVLKPDSESAYT
jgi:hypothetical protein